MCRLLAEKETQIKAQQLDFDSLALRTTELEIKLKDLGKVAGKTGKLHGFYFHSTDSW